MKHVAVLAGGRGTRLGYEGQKCLVPVAGRPFLHWKLDQLIAHDATHIHLLVSHWWQDVIEAVGPNWMGREVIYHLDGGAGQWAAHDAALNTNFFDCLPFVHWITYGDCLLDVPLTISKFPYVYVNDEHPTDAGLIFTWGTSRKFLPRHTESPSYHINTPADLERTRAYLLRRDQ